MSNNKLPECTSYLQQIDKRFIQNGWITVHGENNHCGLVLPQCAEDILNDCCWELFMESTGICIRGNGKYESGYEQNVRPFVYHRSNGEIEIVEEFRLLYNLYRRKTNDGFDYYGFDECGDEIVVAQQVGSTVLVQVKFIKEFIALKKRHLVLFFDADVSTNESLEINKDYKKSDCIYSYSFVPYIYEQGGHGRLIGKSLLRYDAKDIKDLWNWWDKDCEDFIIGYSDDGEEIMHSCDHSTLSNMFVSKPGAPADITPVYFRKDVLDKYYGNPGKYKVEDGHVRCCNYWDLRLDNDRSDNVIVLLVDLGKLPHKEQIHWKTYNIAPPLKDGFSKTAFNRWMCGQYCDTSDAPDLVFKREFKTFSTKWREKYDWDLFLPLASGDEHYFVSLHSLTVSDNDLDFENQLKALAKVIVDSINDKKVANHLDEKDDKSITKLEHWLSIQNADCGEEIQFLRNFQDLRSKYAVHRKSRKGFNKEPFFEYFQMATKTPKEVLDDIFLKMIGVLQSFTNKLLDVGN